MRTPTTLLLAAVSSIVLSATPARVDATTIDPNSVFPSLQRVQQVFPTANVRSIDGDDGHAALFPSCADDRDVDAGPAAAVHRRASYYYRGDDPSPANVLIPAASLYRYASIARAKATMSNIRAHVASCLGRHEGDEDVSTYARWRVPQLGAERVGFVHSFRYTFESPYPRARSVWVRVGRTVLDVSVLRQSGPISPERTLRLARLLVRRAS